jgi:hypothetical protein
MSQAGDGPTDQPREQHTDQDAGRHTERSQDRAEHRTDRQEISDFIEKFSAAFIAGGFPPMPARVFAALHVAESGRLTAAELVDMLQISPAAVSGAVRYLAGLGLLFRERVPGSRREHYRMPGNIWQQVMRNQTQVLYRWADLLKEGAGLVGPDTAAGERMTRNAAFFSFLTTEIPAIFARWEEEGE